MSWRPINPRGMQPDAKSFTATSLERVSIPMHIINMKKTAYLIPALLLTACANGSSSSGSANATSAKPTQGPQAAYVSEAREGLQTAIFAGGCFWCVEKDFEAIEGVLEVKSGYTGGTLDDPDYKTVSYTETGHYEAAEILYDPSVVSYRELVDYFWTTVDPTDDKGQFCDKGSSYRTAIFATAEQMEAAQASLSAVEESKPFSDPIVTPILDAVTFYDAEDYHQDYYKKNPVRYRVYRSGCRRDATLRKLWGDQAQSKP